MYLQLGNIVFEALIGFTDFKRQMEATLPQHALINTKPRLARTGTELQVITGTVQFHSSFCVPEDEIQALENALNTGAILPFIYGNGRVVGNFAVSALTENRLQENGRGDIVMATLDITLKESVVTDSTAANQKKSQDSASALSKNNPSAVRGKLNYPGTDSMKAITAITAAQSEAGNIDTLASKIANTLGFATHGGNMIDLSLDNLGRAMGDVSNVMNGNATLAGLAPNLPGSISTVLNGIVNMRAVLPVTDINALISANGFLQASLAQLKIDSSSISSQLISRRL